MKTIKAKLVLISVILSALSGVVVIFGMRMAYARNVSLLGEYGITDTELITKMGANRNMAIVIAIVMAVVVAVTLIVSLQSMVLKRLDKLVKDGARVVGGDYNTSIAITNEDEIGAIERDFEQFRVLMADAVRQAQG